ncbi:ABC transporter [Roseomonas sp. KE2513]|uniref:restriction system-associated AAA family ATPase n=1 Tax=Roseomonas sp. KE2513 TaxID=2479202 RepID=UPI0018DEF973|nr:restriction system-associated AAA family ATPase [Roseomonas sp. KE2513]MBI0539126.1 ABC transporter [Roseomonas sp. KE2513]
MKLLRLSVEAAASCGGLLDGLEVDFEGAGTTSELAGGAGGALAPHCLIGPNGSGKSQLLQLLAEVFQSAWHAHSPGEEREVADRSTLFSINYLVSRQPDLQPEQVRLRRCKKGRRTLPIEMSVWDGEEWQAVALTDAGFGERLPALIVGYTSGDNETLSLPFFVSRRGYARGVREAAFGEPQSTVSDNRLLLIDYSTHLEVLVANLLLGQPSVQKEILEHARLDRLASFRCVIQLNHLPRLRTPRRISKYRKGVQLTEELEGYIGALKAAATCWSYDPKSEVYILDYLVTDTTRDIFKENFGTPISLYRAFHKLALLNDLAIPSKARDRLKKEIETRRFASRLPEPQDEEKIFRFEQVRFYRGEEEDIKKSLDYVSLSDGEHQQAQVLGVFAMILQNNVLFILDEPESHFNPRWRVEFVKRITTLPVDGRAHQDVLLTSHAPFVPSDLRREQVHVFSKNADGKVTVETPSIETYGAAFDRILEHCFKVSPPISQLARDEIRQLMQAGTPDQLREAINTLGSSFEKAFLLDRLRQLEQGVTFT